jgi:hypothetical protein
MNNKESIDLHSNSLENKKIKIKRKKNKIK